MITTFTQFMDLFNTQGRGDNFSYENLEAIYDHLRHNHGDDYVPDVNDLCRYYSQLYILDIANRYKLSDEEAKELEALEDHEAVMEWLDDYDIDVINVDTWLNVLAVAK